MHKYFLYSGITSEENEISPQKAKKSEAYVKMYFKNNTEEKAEFIRNGEVTKVIYYNRDLKDLTLIENHQREYGIVEPEISNFKNTEEYHYLTIYHFDKESNPVSYRILKGEKIWHWEEEERFSFEGEKWETIKYSYNPQGDLIKELHFRADGSFWYEEEIEQFD